MTLHNHFFSTVLSAAFVVFFSVAPAVAEKHENTAPPPPLTLKQIKASIGKNKAAIGDLKALAAKNNVEAQVYLGDLYMKGVGVYQNYSMAWNWYERAAEKNHAGAQFKLAMMYRDGRGAPLYPEKSAEWLNKAARQGHGEARAFLKKLGLPLPMAMKKPEKMAKGKAGKAKKPMKKYTAPSVEVLLEGMAPALGEAPKDVVALMRDYIKSVNDTDMEALKKLIAPEYAACVNDQNRKVYEDYLLRGLKFKIATSFKAVIGNVDSARLPFRDTLSFPIPPTRYVRLDIVSTGTKPDLERIEMPAGIIQFLANKDGKWSLTLGCPSADGIKRMRYAFGGAKNG